MAKPQVTGPGIVLLETIESANAHTQRLHAIVEKMAMAVRNQQPSAPFGQQFRRAAVPLASLLKARYGMLSDQVTGMILVATRSGNEQRRVSSLREGIGLLRQQLEIATNKVYEHYAVEDGEGEEKIEAE